MNEEHVAKAERLFKDNQKTYEDLIMRKAEMEILISRLKRDKSDLDIHIRIMEQILEDHEPKPKSPTTP